MMTLTSRLKLAIRAAIVTFSMTFPAAASDVDCPPNAVALASAPVLVETPEAQSWVFKRSTFTNDPQTGARVAQYARKDPVEPLEDQRLVTSSYRRTRTVNRGRDGSIDTSYQVQAWGTGGGELGAQWQMFNDVWKESILSGSFYNSNEAAGPWGRSGPGWGGTGWNGGWPGGGWNGGGGNWNGGNGNWNGGGGNWNRDWQHNQPPYGHGKGPRGHWPSDNREPFTNQQFTNPY